MKLLFSITKRRLMLASPAYSLTLLATSGRDECLNSANQACQVASFKGPIPIGHYYINPKDMSNPSLFGDALRNFRPDSPGDWGDWRIRIYAKLGTNTWGRDNFFIHGGSIKGSAGCIDVGGGLTGDQGTDKLLNIISSSLINIDLEVVE